MMITLMALLTIAVEASAMSYEQARNEALFLTDKMAYELNLSDAQYEAAFEINLDYLMGVTSQYDVFGPYWERRNLDLSYILFSWQWDLYRAASYFYRPLFFDAGYWHFGIYARYPHRDYFYFGRPHFWTTYRGGHSWRMNGGRSYYEGRHDYYRPGNRSREQHFGMRNGWDRGDYRNNGGGGRHSSTHVTGQPGQQGHHSGNDRSGYRSVGSRGGYQQGGFGNGRNGNSGTMRQPDNTPGTRQERPALGNQPQGNSSGGHSNSSGSFGGNRSTGSMSSGNSGSGYRQSNSSNSRSSSSSSSSTRSSGSFNHSSGSSSHGGGSFRQSSGSSSSHSSGSMRSSGSTRSGGSSGGSHSGKSNSHGSFGGSRR